MQNRRPNPFLLLCGLGMTFLFAACATAAGQDQGHDSSAVSLRAEAGELYRTACMTCHLPPDPAQAMDRAWLNQVKDTA